ncbi:spore coat protein YlbD [Amphibacillus jilinensis]|uniref:spore coat protein YlbD n=1 Tax=Amphibacillus jilinensis TaxID=1216008 RepID=UPI0002F88415|nr:spore coat protein YlbD [Amphibacillus jilinensis]
MSETKLHPKIQKFKAFIEKHPGMIQTVRNGEQDWSYYYQRYQELGEDDDYWTRFKDDTAPKDEETKKKWTEQLFSIFNKVDFDKVDEHVKQADQAVDQLRKLINHFSEIRGKNTNQPMQMPNRMDRRYY